MTERIITTFFVVVAIGIPLIVILDAILDACK